MEKRHIFVDLNDAATAILQYIGSEDFDKMVTAIKDDASIKDGARAGFSAGLSSSVCIIMENCKKYFDTDFSNVKSDT